MPEVASRNIYADEPSFVGRFLIAALVGLLVSCFIASANYLQNTHFLDKTYIFSMTGYSAVFAVSLGIVAAALSRLPKSRNFRLLTSTLAGVAFGMAATYYLRRFSFPVHRMAFLTLACWVPAAISAMWVSSFGKRWSVFAAITALSLSVIFLRQPLFNFQAQTQEWTVAIVVPANASTARWTAQPGLVGFVGDAEADAARNEVNQDLRKVGYDQPVRILSLTRIGMGKRGLAILIVNNPTQKGTVLSGPDGSVVIYEQHGDTWENKLPKAPTLQRGVEIMNLGQNSADEILYFCIRYEPEAGLVGRIKVESPIAAR